MSKSVSEVSISASAAQSLAQADLDPVVRSEIEHTNENRWGMAEDVRRLRELAPTLPELPEVAAAVVFEAVCAQERRLAAPTLSVDDYSLGTARHADHIAVMGFGPIVLEAQHGTDPIRRATGRREAADHGTAGLAAVLAWEGLGRAVIPRGLQTGNANTDPGHPIKSAVYKVLEGGDYTGFFAIHGMAPNKIVGLRDPSEIHAVIGLGRAIRPESRTAAERLIAEARDRYGLRLVIGNDVPHLNFAKDPRWDQVSFRDLGSQLATNEDGTIRTRRLAATGDDNTVTYVNQATDDRPDFCAMQLEISRSLRLTPKDYWVRRDAVATRMGVYLGYLLSKLAAERIAGDTIKA
jgi:hypothetical protein